MYVIILLMKQRVRVICVVQNKEEFLLLRRSAGRSERLDMYGLPVGKIHFGEQPEEAMARTIYEYVGIRPGTVRLVDVITFVDLHGVSELANLYIIYGVEFNDDVVNITTDKFNGYKWVDENVVKSTAIDEASLMILDIVNSRKNNVVKNTKYRGDDGLATIFTDGGSRGNPGPSGLGYYILGANGELLKKGGEFLGFSTSRVAEYYGLKEGIEQAIDLGLKSAHFKSDSLMLVNQMNGVYRVKNKDLMPIYDDIWKLLEKLDVYSFEHVPRDNNREADSEVNRAIDEHLRRAE